LQGICEWIATDIATVLQCLTNLQGISEGILTTLQGINVGILSLAKISYTYRKRVSPTYPFCDGICEVNKLVTRKKNVYYKTYLFCNEIARRIIWNALRMQNPRKFATVLRQDFSSQICVGFASVCHISLANWSQICEELISLQICKRFARVLFLVAIHS